MRRRIRCHKVDTVVGRAGGHFSLAQHAIVEEHVVDEGGEQVGRRAEKCALSNHVAYEKIVRKRLRIDQFSVEIKEEYVIA